MPSIIDKEFGTIAVRKSGRSTSMRATIAPDGTLRLTVPSYTPTFVVKRMIASSRDNLRQLLARRPTVTLSDGMAIGKHHTLVLRHADSMSIKRSGSQLILNIPSSEHINDPLIVDEVRVHFRALLRKEAKQHLPNRIRYLADTHGFGYSSLRFTHASSRWGSCNSKQAISLNIALMNLPNELIDYVLIHELSHTVHMNHSAEFWATVQTADPDMKRHRAALKRYDPGI